MTAIRKALGLAENVEFQGETWPLEPLTFLDLADAEALGLMSGDAGDLSPTSVLWLMLRKADPSLTPTQRDLCQYTLTPRETRALFTLGDDSLAAAEFMSKVIEVAGLTAGEEEMADASETEAPAKKGRGGRGTKPPEIPATPIAE